MFFVHTTVAATHSILQATVFGGTRHQPADVPVKLQVAAVRTEPATAKEATFEVADSCPVAHLLVAGAGTDCAARIALRQLQRALAGHVIVQGTAVPVKVLGHLVLLKLVAADPAEHQVLRISDGDATAIHVQKRLAVPKLVPRCPSSHPVYMPALVAGLEILGALHQRQTSFALVTGPVGAGKRTLLEQFARGNAMSTVEISLADLKLETNAVRQKQVVNAVILKAVRLQPALILLTGTDTLAGHDGTLPDERTAQVLMAALLARLPHPGANVFVAALALRRDKLPRVLLSAQGFSREIQTVSPDYGTRRGILRALVVSTTTAGTSSRGAGGHGSLEKTQDEAAERREGKGEDNDEDRVDKVARTTAGYLPGDLVRLCRSAWCSGVTAQLTSPATRKRPGKHPQLDWQRALARVRPSALNQFKQRVPHVAWEDVVGYEATKVQLRRIVAAIEGSSTEGTNGIGSMGIHPKGGLSQLQAPRGLLLHGPPGCGKSLLTRALLSNSSLNVISASSTALFSKYMGETEQQIRALFSAARQCRPCAVFIDEIDSLVLKRGSEQASTTGVEERALSQLLNEIDGIQDSRGIFVVGCTNRPVFLQYSWYA